MAEKSNLHYIADEGLGGIEREYIEVDRKASEGDYVVVTNNVGDKNALFPEEYKTLEPTGNVRHNGERYRMVKREVKRGDTYIVVADTCGRDYGIFKALRDIPGTKGFVLEPIETKTTEDHIVSLAKTVAEQQRRINELERSLSRRIDSTARDVETFAEEFTEFKAEQTETTEMILDDIVTLDERTQSEEIAKAIADKLRKATEGGRI